MRFQLVLQWLISSSSEFDELISLEELLMAKLTDQSDVDGHNFGSGKANIFIHTNDPHGTLKEIRGILSGHKFWPNTVIAYRESLGTEYTVLWPEGTTEFRVQ